MMSEERSNQGGDRFPLTRWSVIEAARGGDEAERLRAMDTLCASYWKPVYKYVRMRWNRPAEDAQDLTQGFFVQLIEGEGAMRWDLRHFAIRNISASKHSKRAAKE